MKITTPPLTKAMTRSCRDRQTRLICLTPLIFAYFTLSPTTQAVTPAPDGGYPGGNTAEGAGALFSLTSGTYNTAIGLQTLYHLTTGIHNTATGAAALFSNTTGTLNTATGFNALRYNTIGGGNTANGWHALFSNSSGSGNTATGTGALYRNNTGGDNTAQGEDALHGNVSGIRNTATGTRSLYSNAGGNFNTATGDEALYSNYGSYNTAYGAQALYFNKNGARNTAIGIGALSGSSGSNGSDNIALGYLAGGDLMTGTKNIDIGNRGFSGDSATIRIGDTQTRAFIAGIHGRTIPQPATLYTNSTGQIGTIPSSARFKENIQSMAESSDLLFALRPVTFRYKTEIDSTATRQFGLVAEEVEKVNPDLVAHDGEGKPYTVRYDAVNAMLLNEFLKAHRTLTELKSIVARQDEINLQQQKKIDDLTTQLKGQADQIQKVNAYIELNKSSPQTALTNRSAYEHD
jgi:hypothetical protein